MPSLSSDNSINVKINTDANTAGVEKAQNSLRGLKEHTDNASNSTGSLTGSFMKAQIGADIIEGAFNKVAGAARSFTDDTTQLGRETMKMQRELGVTAEQGSSLIAVFGRFGINADGASKSLGLFAKNMVAANDGNQTAIDHFNVLGLSVKDGNGHLKNTSDMLLEVADKFKGMQNGTEKTALAMQLFGKSGKDMLPILNQGRDGIEELEEHAAKLGVTLTQGNIDAIRKNIAAHKDYNEAIEGVKIRIGNALMPVMASWAQQMTSIVTSDKFQKYIKEIPPIIQAIITKIKEFVSGQEFQKWLHLAIDVLKELVNMIKDTIKMWDEHRGAMRLVIQIIGSLLVAFYTLRSIIGVIEAIKKAWMVFSAIMETNPIILILTLIIAAAILLSLHWKRVTEDMKIAWQAVSSFFSKIWNDIVGFFSRNASIILGLILGPIGIIIANWGAVTRFFSGLWGSIKGGFDNAYNGMVKWAKGAVNDIVGFFTGLPGRIGDVVGNISSKIAGDIKGAFHKLHIPGFATGVRGFGGGYAVVGENGPELVSLPPGTDVYNNKDSGKMLANQSGSQGSNINVTQHIYNQLDYNKGIAELGWRMRNA